MKIQNKKFEEKDIRSFVSLISKEKLLNNQIKNKKFVKWKFTKNPLGKSNYFFLKNKKKIIGRILSSAFASRVFLNQRSKKTYLLSDLLIERKYRSPLNNLINLYLRCLSKTPGIVLHSSNSNSENIYKRILKKNFLFNLISYGFPLNAKAFKFNFFFTKLFY